MLLNIFCRLLGVKNVATLETRGYFPKTGIMKYESPFEEVDKLICALYDLNPE